MTRRNGRDYFLCPHCGAEIRAGSAFCRACGASDESGWDTETDFSADEDDDFDYDDYVAREFPEHAPQGRDRPGRGLWKFIAALLILAMLWWALRGG